MTRQRAEVQDSWKEFTQNVIKMGTKKEIDLQKSVEFRNNSELKMLTEQPENLVPKFVASESGQGDEKKHN